MTARDAVDVTWLGYGRMGEAMVERLLKGGKKVAVWNRTPSRLQGLDAAGATVLSSSSESTAPVVFSMIADDAALDALAGSDDGPLAAAVPPKVWVDCSTVSVNASMRAAQAATEVGTAFVCAPVSGNPEVVRHGSLTFAVSGRREAIDYVRPLLDIMGPHTYVVGDQYQARVVKLCTNAVLAGLTELLAECLILGERSGVRRSAMMEFINASAVGSPFTRYKTDAFVALDLAPTFTPELLRKDVRLALDLGRDLEVPLPAVANTELTLSRLVASDLGNGLDFASLLLLAARDAGTTIEAEVS